MSLLLTPNRDHVNNLITLSGALCGTAAHVDTVAILTATALVALELEHQRQLGFRSGFAVSGQKKTFAGGQ
jgi:hypothetical protein